MRVAPYFISVGILFIHLVSCGPKHSKNITEGVIEYDIDYDSITLSRIDKKVLPSSLVVQFQDNNTINTIEALSGAVTISIISQPRKREFVTLLKVFNKKLYHDEPYTEGLYPALYARIPKVVIDSLNQECNFLGFKCFRVQGYYVDTPDSRFEIIYTNDISIDNPNQNTPFEGIEGVMLAFNLRLSKVNMFLKAREVRKSRISGKAFTIPDDYKRVDLQTMTDLLYLLQQ